MTETVDTQAAELDRPEAQQSTDLWLLLGGSTVSRLGSISVTMAFPLLALEANFSPAFAGAVTAAGILPILLMYPLAGVLADRFDRRKIMIYSQLARALVFMLLGAGLAGSAGHRLLMVLLPLAAALDGVFLTLYNTAEIAAFPRLFPPKETATLKAVSKSEAQNHGALALGRPLSGFLCGAGSAYPFAFGAATTLISVLTLTKIEKNRFRMDRCGKRHTTPIREAVTWLRSDKPMRRAMMVCTITNLLFQAIILLLIIMAKKNGFPHAFIGILLAASGVGGMLVACTAPRLLYRISLSRVSTICTWIWLLLTLTLLISDHPIVLVAAWFGVGFVGGHMNVALTAYQARSVPERLRGRVAGLKSFATRAPSAIGALMAGLVISMLDTQAVIWSVFITMVLLTCAVTYDHLTSIGRSQNVVEGAL
ncbi:MFS transporter [Thermomonospora sp. CIF 1]|uniref:MFS transporter n=1 Tax=Thermomonospora sp. CIF 1 TaxID=1916083 RepID=UPI00257AA13D|nr:MFS transporter [Thermomonospora sp. CIF 1]